MSEPTPARSRPSVGATILAGFLIALIGVVVIAAGVILGLATFGALVIVGFILLGASIVVMIVALVTAMRVRAARRTDGM